MSNKARNYTKETIRKLYLFSGNQCAYPKCTNKILAEDGKTIIGEIAHIQAASKNGPRYYPEISEKERADFSNLIFLCDEHHKIIDNKANEDKYPIEFLKKWKADHEAKFEKNKIEVPDTVIEQIAAKLEDYLKDLADRLIEATLEADKTILDEIFDFIYKEKINEENAKIKFEKDGLGITKKIKINFEGNQRKRVTQIIAEYFKYEYIIREFIEIEKENNAFRVDGLRDTIQDIFCELKKTQDTETIIQDFNVFTEIAKQLLPVKKQQDTKFIFNAKLIVIYFFEFCEIGKKTEEEMKNNQIKFDL